MMIVLMGDNDEKIVVMTVMMMAGWDEYRW